jgi:hypothetical protein
MVDEANTKLMRDYVVEVSHIEDENYNNKWFLLSLVYIIL